MKKINDIVGKLERIDFELIIPFQGNLKDLTIENYEKLKKQILDKSFAFPIDVWEDKESKKIYTIDGHQRIRCLHKMKQEGYEIPKIPCVFIEASGYKEAKELLLARTSQYGTMTDQGLYEYLAESGIDWRNAVESFTFDSIDFNEFAMNFYGESLTNEEKKELTIEDTNQFIVSVECKNEKQMSELFDELKNRGFECNLIR